MLYLKPLACRLLTRLKRPNSLKHVIGNCFNLIFVGGLAQKRIGNTLFDICDLQILFFFFDVVLEGRLHRHQMALFALQNTCVKTNAVESG